MYGTGMLLVLACSDFMTVLPVLKPKQKVPTTTGAPLVFALGMLHLNLSRPISCW
jgi:hypothetical protein